MKKTDFRHPDLAFECSRCGLCCGDTPNRTRHIRLTKLDAEGIAQAPRREIGSYCTPTPENAPYIHEMHKTPEGNCVFLVNNQCTIYDARPLICRFYPFQLSMDFDGIYVFEATAECPAIGAEGGKRLEGAFFRGLFELARKRLGFEEP
jgi:Fe-S-cluster containining protein